MISADVKNDVKQKIKKLVAVCYNFFVVDIPCSLILSIKNGEDEGREE